MMKIIRIKTLKIDEVKYNDSAIYVDIKLTIFNYYYLNLKWVNIIDHH